MIRYMLTAILLLLYFAVFVCICLGAVYVSYLVSSAIMGVSP